MSFGRNLKSLLDQLADGRIQLPDFQRSWCWTEDKIRALIESISRKHPIGTLLLISKGGRSFSTRPVHGATVQPGADPSILVMDGQQRITSLFQVFMTRRPVAIRTGTKFASVSFYVDIAAANKTGWISQDCLISARIGKDGKATPHTRKTLGFEPTDVAEQFKRLLIPSGDILNPEAWQRAYEDFNDATYPDSEIAKVGSKELTSFIRGIGSLLLNYPIVETTLDESITDDEICTIYEKMNMNVQTLGAFDLLIAQYRSHGINLRKDLEGSNGDGALQRIDGMFRFHRPMIDPTNYLQAVFLAARMKDGILPTTVGKSEIMKLSYEEYKNNKTTVMEGFKTLAEALSMQCIIKQGDMPSAFFISGVAASLGNSKISRAHSSIKEKVMPWLWASLIKKSFTHGADANFIRELSQLSRYVSGGEELPSRFAANTISESSLLYSKKGQTTVSIIGAMILRNGAIDFKNGYRVSDFATVYTEYDLHHIFPVKYCQGVGIPASLYNSVYNLTPMSAGTNRSIGGRPPSQYLERIATSTGRSAAEIDEAVLSHGIDSGSLRRDAFYTFIERRRNWLIALIESETQSAVERHPGFSETIADRKNTKSRGSVKPLVSVEVGPHA